MDKQQRPSTISSSRSTSRAPSLPPSSPRSPGGQNPHQFVIGPRRDRLSTTSTSREPSARPLSPKTPRTPSSARTSRRGSTRSVTNNWLQVSMPDGPKPSWSRQRTDESSVSSMSPKHGARSPWSMSTASTAESLPSTGPPEFHFDAATAASNLRMSMSKELPTGTPKWGIYLSEAGDLSDDHGTGSPAEDKASSVQTHWGIVRENVKQKSSVKSKGELDKEFGATFAEMLPDIKQKFVAGIAAESEEHGWRELRKRQVMPEEKKASNTLYVDALMKGDSDWDTKLHVLEARRRTMIKEDAVPEDPWGLAA